MEIRHLAAETSLYRPFDGSHVVVAPVDVLGGLNGDDGREEVKSRLRRISGKSLAWPLEKSWKR